MIIGVDFDGTCVEHTYPEVGPDVPYAASLLTDLVAAGHQLILWTMRSGDDLEAAKHWFFQYDIPLLGANENPTQSNWTESPKAYCHYYIDDAAVGCPLMDGVHGDRPMVNWLRVEAILVGKGVLPRG